MSSSSPVLSSNETKSDVNFEELWRQLGECHQNALQELEAKVAKLKKERCLDAQKLEVFYNRSQQLKEQNKTLQDTISGLEERLRVGECDRCAILEANQKSNEEQNAQLINRYKQEKKALDDDNKKLKAELEKVKRACSDLQGFSSPEQDDCFIPDSPVMASSLPAANKLKKRKNTEKSKFVRYAERSLPLAQASLFIEADKDLNAMEKPVKAEVLVPNTCELDASQADEEVNSEEVIAETCRLDLLPHCVKKQKPATQQQTTETFLRSKVLTKYYTLPQVSASVYTSLNSTTDKSPSLLPRSKRFPNDELNDSNLAKRKKEESQLESQDAKQEVETKSSQTVQPKSEQGGFEVGTQEVEETVKKCRGFLAALIKLAKRSPLAPDAAKNVTALVQDLLDAKIETEEFLTRLGTELKSPPHPHLIPFLKKNVPALRQSGWSVQQSLMSVPNPAAGTASSVAAAGTVSPASSMARLGTPLGNAAVLRQSNQDETLTERQDVPYLSPVFKKPNAANKQPTPRDDKNRPPLEDRKSLCQPNSENSPREFKVEPMWSMDPGLALEMYESEEGSDEEKEENHPPGEMMDSDCTWISHSLLQGRAKNDEDESYSSGLGDKANDSLDRLFDTSACGVYKSYNTPHMEGDDQASDQEDEGGEEEEDHCEEDAENSIKRRKPGQPAFPHVAVIRKKDERRKLKGTTCKECEIYYAHLPEEERRKKLSNCSRHRYLYIPPCTPENFWEVGFPSTQTCIERGYIKEDKNPQSRSRRRQPLNALFSPKGKKKEN